MLDHEDFEHLDPGQAYFSLDYEVLYVVQRPLYSNRPNTLSSPIPDMASSPPQISSDGKTITVHIRSGVHFSPPVNREVTSADVAYAIERGANPNVANPYFHSYFSSLEGAEKANGGPFPGITTPDSHTIVFHLAEPRAQIVADALVLPLSAPVPRNTPSSSTPRTRANTATTRSAPGPTCSRPTPTGQFLGIGYQTGKSATLVRNPNWNATPTASSTSLGEPRQININIGGDAEVIGRQVLQGSDTVQNDTPSQAIVKLAYERYPSQLTFTQGAGTHYVSIDNAHGVFSNENLRKAFWAALDRRRSSRPGAANWWRSR